MDFLLGVITYLACKLSGVPSQDASVSGSQYSSCLNNHCSISAVVCCCHAVIDTAFSCYWLECFASGFSSQATETHFCRPMFFLYWLTCKLLHQNI